MTAGMSAAAPHRNAKTQLKCNGYLAQSYTVQSIKKERCPVSDTPLVAINLSNQ